MKRLIMGLWHDEHGVILSTEIVIVGSVLVVGLITGMVSLQEAVNTEMSDLAGAIGSLDQSYSYSGQVTTRKKCQASTAGSCFRDQPDCCDEQQADIVASSAEGVVQKVAYATPCAVASCTGCNSTESCSSCGTAGTCGSCTSTAACQIRTTGAIDVQTGVTGVKVSQWPLGHADAGCIHGVSCDDPCKVCEKESFINIPEYVW